MKGERLSSTGVGEINEKNNLRASMSKVAGAVAVSLSVASCGMAASESSNQNVVHEKNIQPVPSMEENVPPPEIPLPDSGSWSVMPGMADPNIVKLSDDSYYLSGTAEITSSIPIYHSEDLRSFTQANEYNPSEQDPRHDYCNLWAPSISKTPNGDNRILFTAKRTAEGQACQDSNSEQTIFYANAEGDGADFGPAHLMEAEHNLPRGHTGKDCLADGCHNTLRIDPEMTTDKKGDRWLFYNWFGLGQNVISSVNIDNTSQRHEVAVPTPGDGDINEAPDVFERDGQYYMVYSRNFYDSNYGLSYIQADDVSGLTRANSPSHKIADAEHTPDGRIASNIGHSSVVEKDGEYYMYHHKGEFDDNGNYTGRRSTYAQKLHFDAEGKIMPLTNDVIELS